MQYAMQYGNTKDTNCKNHINKVFFCFVWFSFVYLEKNIKNRLVSKWNEEWRHKRILEKLICRVWSEKKYFLKKH